MDADEPLELDDDFSWRRAPVLVADRLGVRPLSVVAGAVGIVAAGIGAWWALRPPPPPVEATLPVVSDVAVVPTTSTSVVLVLVVHVDGAVARPGVHDVVAGSRVIDAVEAAGGLTADADRSRINLAQPVADGQRIWIPAVGEDAPEAVIGGAQSPEPGEGTAGGPVSLSTANASQLESLPGIGPALAAAILEHRERVGSFERVDDLLDVTGIGPAKLDAIRDLVEP